MNPPEPRPDQANEAISSEPAPLELPSTRAVKVPYEGERDKWTVFTQIKQSKDRSFEVHVHIGIGSAPGIDGRRLPVYRRFSTSESARAFVMDWMEEYEALNHVRTHGPQSR